MNTYPYCGRRRDAIATCLQPRGLFAFVRLLMLLLAAAAASAQEAATGSIEGRVFNAITGRYLPNAHVTVEGTTLEATTNQYGEFVLRDVPAGEATVVAEYTGQPSRRLPLTVPPGGTVNLDIVLGANQVTPDGAVVLSEFRVDASRFEDAAAIAIAQERAAINIKNVVSTDAFGEIAQGNLGEFVKYLPGVQIDYGGAYNSGADATSISVRGFRPIHTGVYIDGIPVANAAPGNLTRATSLDLLTINQASRIELTKVPTPDMPMDSMGGSINLISKTAFEYAKPLTDIEVFLNLNSENLDIFKKTPGPANKKTYKALPNAVINYIHPVNAKFGFAVNAASYNQFNENHNADIEWMFEGDDSQRPDGTYADLRAPFISHLELRDRPRNEHRHSAGFRLDYKPWEHTSVNLKFQYSLHEAIDVERIVEIESEEAEDWGPTHVIGADGEASVQQIIRSLDRDGDSYNTSLTFNHRRGPWQIGATLSTSRANASLVNIENGHFSELELPMSGEERVIFEDIRNGIPRRIIVHDEDGQPIDPSRLSNYVVDYDGTEPLHVRAGNTDSTNIKDIYKVDVRRELDFLDTSFSQLAVKVGYFREDNTERKRGRGTNYQYVYFGPPEALDISKYEDEVYSDVEPGFGLPAWQWADVYQFYEFYQENPDYFSDTSDDTTHNGAANPGTHTSVAANNWREYVNTNKNVTESETAWYAQLEGQFLNNRLSVVGGLRGERFERSGYGPQRDPDWQFLKTPEGLIYRGDPKYPNGINVTNATHFANVDRERLAAAGITWDHVVINRSLEAMQREYRVSQPIEHKSSGKPAYSVNLSYDINDKLVARVGYSRTFGKVDYEDGFLRRIEFDQNPSNPNAGVIRVGNPELEPEVSDSYDFNVAYYTEAGGKFSLSYFTKDVENFHINRNTVLTNSNYQELLRRHDITPLEEYIGWTLSTSEMGVGTAKNRGYEIDIQQKLDFLGRWAQGFFVFANYSTTKKSENQDASGKLGATADSFSSGGIAYDRGRWSVRVNATWRNDKIIGDFNVPIFDENGDELEDADGNAIEAIIFEYEPAEVRVDASVDFRLTDRYSLYVTGRNITNTKSERKYFEADGLLPDYATTYAYNDFGFQWTVGVRARF